MSIAFLQAKSGHASSAGTTYSLTFSSAIPAGAFLFCVVSPGNSPGASANSISVSDNINGAWTKGVEGFSAFSSQGDFFYFADSGAGTITVTVSYGVSVTLYMGIGAYSGVDPVTPFDAGPTVSAYHTATPYTGPNLTTTLASDMLIAVLTEGGNPGTVTVSGGYTMRSTEPQPVADFAPGTIGAQTGPTFTVQFGGNNFVVGAALKAASTAVPYATQAGYFLCGL